ncbi:MAG: hypothetical protein IPK74_01390 [Deltaproteobacteria bacterium]|nr:hypothetical protein [Deltaproteobacteria bacterium]
MIATLLSATLALAPALALAPTATAPDLEGDIVMKAMKDELARTSAMKLPDSPAPYWASYHAVDVHDVVVQSSFGALLKSETNLGRVVAPRVRVGGYELDAVGLPMMAQPPLVTIEDDYDALRHALWRFTDGAYKMAATGFKEAQTEQTQRTVDADRPASFSARTTPIVTVHTEVASAPEQRKLEALANEVSAVFREHDFVDACEVTVWVHDARRRYVATDGDASIEDTRFAVLSIQAIAQADDGDRIGRTVTRVGRLRDFDDAARYVADAQGLARELAALRKAPMVRDYQGPVLIEATAVAELMGMIVAQEMTAGGRWGSDTEAKLGQLVLPRGVTMFDDPGISTHGGHALLGGYAADDEGTPAQRVALVEDGKLTALLTGRTPGKKLKQSNGHARSGPYAMDLRPSPSNLVIEAKRGLSDAALQKQLRTLATKRGLEFGIVVTDVAMGRGTTVAYRVGKDGKRELVRVGFMRGLEPSELRKLAAVGRATAVVHQTVLGGMPFSADEAPPEVSAFATLSSVVAPAMLVEDAEFRSFGDSHPKPPAYPRPALNKR